MHYTQISHYEELNQMLGNLDNNRARKCSLNPSNELDFYKKLVFLNFKSIMNHIFVKKF